VKESLQPLAEPLSWRFVTELWRRHPCRFQLIETHPCSGQYDCLSLFNLDGETQHALNVSRAGSVHVHVENKSGSWPDWAEQMLTDPKHLLEEVESAMGLNAPGKLPRSTPATLAFRFISDFLTHCVGRLEKWECRNGFWDTSGYGGGRRTEWFEQFAGIESGPPARLPEACCFDSASGYWFLCKNGTPLLCVDAAGQAYNTKGETYDLVCNYRYRKSIWRLITAFAVDLLP